MEVTRTQLRIWGFRAAAATGAVLVALLAVFVIRDLMEEDPPPLDLSSVAPIAPGGTRSCASAPDTVATERDPPAAAATEADAQERVPPGRTVAPRLTPAVATNPAPVVARPRTFPTNVPPARQVRLANRTRVVEKYRRPFPKKFAAKQQPTARGTLPYLIVSELPVSGIVRDRVSKLGARVIGFMPVNSLIVEINENALRKIEGDVLFTGAFELEPVDKVQRGVWERTIAEPSVDVSIVPLSIIDLPVIESWVKEKGGTILEGAGNKKRALRATVPSKLVDELSGRGEVRWIEAFTRPKLHNDVAVNPGLMNVREVWNTHGLTGEGEIISTSDSGIDTGDIRTLHADFAGRILGIYSILVRDSIPTLKLDTEGHGTHTAGSIVGTGVRSNGRIKGVAHGAKLLVTAGFYNGNLYFTDLTSLFQPSGRYTAHTYSQSWGGDYNGYEEWCEELDAFVWNNPDFLPVISAGNTGAFYGANSVGTPATAKNCLAVGATESLRSAVERPQDADNASQIAYFSSLGPASDGRIKPDICAPGTFIFSTRSTQAPADNYWAVDPETQAYGSLCGTSMSCPLVAGAAALVREWLVKRRGYETPTAALVKAVLTGGAHDMVADAGTNCTTPAPANDQGWGRVDLEETLFPSNRVVCLYDRIAFSGGSDACFRVTVTNVGPLEAQLVWIDYPAEVLADSALVNDLDLVVSNETTGVVWYGNGVQGGDRTNNVEGVRIATAGLGVYAVHVKGVAVPYDSTEGGAAALYLRGAFREVVNEDGAKTYPLRRRSYFPLLDDWGTTVTTWCPSGTVVRVSVPDDLPDEEELLRGWVWTDDDTGVRTPLADQRLAEIEVAPADGAGEFRHDRQGRMATEFDVLVDGAKDVRFHYYPVTNRNEQAGLPDWWWRRNLRGATGDGESGWATGDADGDGISNYDEYRADTDPLDAMSTLRILAFSPTNIVWRGGRDCTQVVERASAPGADALWTGVFTNTPPTASEVACPLPGTDAANWFYRVRALGR